MKTKQILGLTVFVLIAIFTGYYYSTQEHATDSIRIAVAGPMTGQYAVNGQSFVQGIQLCLQNMHQQYPSKNFSVKIDIIVQLWFFMACLLPPHSHALRGNVSGPPKNKFTLFS